MKTGKIAKLSALVLAIVMLLMVGVSASASDSVYAKYTSSTVMINGNVVAFEAYNIGGNNYFKLRDLAMALNGTEASFSVEWSAADNCIVVELGSYMCEPNYAYQPVGGELAVGDGTDKVAYVSTQSLLAPMDGGFPGFTAYNINGNNYFKLRDIGDLFGFNVDWDAANNCILINTTY